MNLFLHFYRFEHFLIPSVFTVSQLQRQSFLGSQLCRETCANFLPKVPLKDCNYEFKQQQTQLCSSIIKKSPLVHTFSKGLYLILKNFDSNIGLIFLVFCFTVKVKKQMLFFFAFCIGKTIAVCFTLPCFFDILKEKLIFAYRFNKKKIAFAHHISLNFSLFLLPFLLFLAPLYVLYVTGQ